MNKGVARAALILMVPLFIVVLGGVREAGAFVSLYNNKLLLKGSIEEFAYVRTFIPGDENNFHNSRINMLLTTGRFEAFWNAVDKEDFTINVQGIVRYYYEAMMILDRRMYNGMHEGNRNQHVTPNFRHDDPLCELFVDVTKGPFQFRVGKQIVAWGETELRRTADVINPLDLRYGAPGILPFEDLKIGLYMLRMFYTVPDNIPGNLFLETIFIPSDHQMLRIPPSGTMWGAGFKGTLGDQIFPMIQNIWKEDEPRLSSLKYYQWGMRLRGVWNWLDWTLQYFDSVDFLPVAIPDRANQQMMAYMRYNMYYGKTNKPTPDVPRVADEIFQYKRTKYFGAIGQWLDERFTKGVMRLEVTYQMGKHYNTDNYYGKNVTIPGFHIPGTPITVNDQTLTDKSLVTGTVKRDAVGFGYSLDRPTLWPWLMKYNDNRKLDITFQVFSDWILNHQRNLAISGRGRGDKNVTECTLQFMTQWFKSELTTVYKTLYDFSGYGYNVFTVLYAPGDYWRYEVGSMLFYTLVNKEMEPNSWDKSNFYFRIKYEW